MKLTIVVLVVITILAVVPVYAHQGFKAGPEDLGNTPGAVFARMDTAACKNFKTVLAKQTSLVNRLLHEVGDKHATYMAKLSPIVNDFVPESMSKSALVNSVAELASTSSQFALQGNKLKASLAELNEQPCDEYLVMQNFLDESRTEYEQVHELDHKFRELLSTQVKENLNKVILEYENK
jgi:hypothetical protein